MIENEKTLHGEKDSPLIIEIGLKVTKLWKKTKKYRVICPEIIISLDSSDAQLDLAVTIVERVIRSRGADNGAC